MKNTRRNLAAGVLALGIAAVCMISIPAHAAGYDASNRSDYSGAAALAQTIIRLRALTDQQMIEKTRNYIKKQGLRFDDYLAGDFDANGRRELLATAIGDDGCHVFFCSRNGRIRKAAFAACAADSAIIKDLGDGYVQIICMGQTLGRCGGCGTIKLLVYCNQPVIVEITKD